MKQTLRICCVAVLCLSFFPAVVFACATDSDCGTDQRCIQLPIGGQCVDTCSQDADCGSGMICESAICIPSCTSDADCGDGYTCNGRLCEESSVSGQSGGSNILNDLTVLNPLSARTVPQLIGQMVRFVTGLFGSIALVMIIYGGIQIMLAGGQGDKVRQGAKVIAWASIGLVTMMLSYVLVSFVLAIF